METASTEGTKYRTDDLRIVEVKELSTPEAVHAEYPISDVATQTICDTRNAIHNILCGKDDRLLVIIGPCSIHDPEAGLEYARRLAKVRERLQKDLLIVMRVYFEKPRTTVGWKGLINDPDLDETYHINKGLRLARKVLLDINNLGIGAATEYLDLITPQYIADLISWGAIGARTTESQVHRELASGLSCPVGFKNGTDGTLSVAVDGIRAAERPHHFLSLTKAGHSAIFSTSGNDDCHIILRGGKSPNYEAGHVDEAAKALSAAGMRDKLMVDCSHANSAKQHKNQIQVAANVAEQLRDGEQRIMGVMIESHLVEGRQDVVPGKELVFGQSITDACLSWDDSEPLLESLADAVRVRREQRG